MMLSLGLQAFWPLLDYKTKSSHLEPRLPQLILGRCFSNACIYGISFRLSHKSRHMPSYV